MGARARRWIVAAGLAFLPSATLAAGADAASDAADRAATAGQAHYAQYCAVCHGGGGRGDGPSAAGFATRPADLTDGRLMNALPDEFLANVIRNGGPAEGLSPAMPPLGRFLGDAETRAVIAYLRSLARPPFHPALAQPLVTVPHAPRQPILFNHVIHAGSFQIACQYCHADARRSDYAGLPSVERCLGCHKIIGAADNPEIAKIHEYGRRREAVPWVRVFKVPEYVHFPHKPHVRAELACQTCHGPVERMRVVGADNGRSLPNDLINLVGLRPAARPLTMGWCIDCHRRENTARGTHAPMDCATCHH
jgi:mono/diheme cytochrome c family protein